MKKVTLIICALSLLSVTGRAQRFFFWAGLGYAIPQAGQTIDGGGVPYNGTRSNSTYLQSYNLKNASFSAGGQGSFGIGYLFTDHIGVQLNADMALLAKEYKYHDNNATVDLGNGP